MKRITNVGSRENRNSGMSTTWDRLTGNWEPVSRLTRKRIPTCFPPLNPPSPYPLHSEFTSSERRNEPSLPRILFLPVRWIHEEVACIRWHNGPQGKLLSERNTGRGKGSFKGKWFTLSLVHEPTIPPPLLFTFPSFFIFLTPLPPPFLLSNRIIFSPNFFIFPSLPSV